MRKFEKISFEQFKKDIKDDKELYENYLLPTRSTKKSAGYDIRSLEEYTLKPGESKAFTTGLKVSMNDDEVFNLYIRSSLGYKYNVTLTNGVGVIDSDYYNNSDNEGHIYVSLQNEGDKEYVIRKGTAYCQGIFLKYFTCGDKVEEIRNGGIGSTDKEMG